MHSTDAYMAAVAANVVAWELCAYWCMSPGFTISQRVDHYWEILGPAVPLLYIAACVGGYGHFFGWKFWR